MIDDADWTRLSRYVTGECSTEDAEATRRWIESDPERRDALAFMRRADEVAAESRPTWDQAAAWKHLAARKSAREQRATTPHSVPVVTRRPGFRVQESIVATPTPRRRALRIAATVLVAAAAGAGGWTAASRGGRTTGPALAISPGSWREITTRNGQRASLTLGDGSEVILAPASRLRYPAGERGCVREARTCARAVYLDGEALFSVTHDSLRPFRVYTAGAVTEDLGTAFSVRAYDGAPSMRVVVAEGSVELRSLRLPAGHKGAVLSAGQLGRLTPSGDALVQPAADVEGELAWARGRLVFHDTPLAEVLPQLERWYDIRVRLADSTLASRRVTGSYNDEPAAQVVRDIALTLGIRVERQGRVVVLRAARPGRYP